MTETPPAPSPEEWQGEPSPLQPGPSEANPWSLSDFFLLFIGQHALSLFAYSVMTAFVPEPSKPTLRYFMVLATLLSNGFLVVLYAFRVRWHHRVPWKDIGWRWPHWKDALRWGITFLVLVFLFNALYQWLLRAFELGRPQQEIAGLFGPGQPLSLKILALLLVSLAAPFAEEVLYRGVLFPATLKYLSPHNAAILSGLLFGAIHFEPRTILPLGFLGYLLCLTYHYTRSLWLCVLLHAINNSLAFALLLIFQ